jgi:hypothetical protein
MGILMDDEWGQIAAEFLRRDATTITAVLKDSGIDGAWVDHSLEHTDANRDKLQAQMDDAWRKTGASGRAALLLAVYVYVRSQQAWELSVDHDQTGWTVRKALETWEDQGRSLDDPDALVVHLMLRKATVLPDCMAAEDALNCSCPVTLGERAEKVVGECRELLAQSVKLPHRWDGFRQQFLDVVLRGHVANYAALCEVGGAVNAWIERGRAARPKVASAIAFVREQEQLPALRGDVYESELRGHRRVLETIAHRIADPAIPVVRLDEASVTYCYPFALEGISAERAMALALDRLGAREREITDVWTWGWTKEPPYQAVSVRLPDLTVHPAARRHQTLAGHEVELRLSTLGNHAIYIRRRFDGPATLHDVNQAMRRGSIQMGPEEIIYAEKPSTVPPAWPPPAGPWKRLPDFAEELVKWLVAALNGPAGHQPTKAFAVMNMAAQFHVSLEVRRLSVLGQDGKTIPAGAAELLAAAAPLLLHPIRPNASGLEEWVRNPSEQPRNLTGDAGFRGDLVVRTANTSVVVMTGTPNWVLLSYAEMIDFVASLPPLFQLWKKQLDPDTEIEGIDLATTDEAHLAERRIDLQNAIKDVRRPLSALHSPELVETPSFRSFLDRLYDAAGLLRLQEQLLETISQVEAAHTVLSGYLLVKEKQEQKQERQREQGYQRRVSLVLVIIGFFSIADLLTFVNGLMPWIPRDPAALLPELLGSAGLAVTLALAVYKPRAVKAFTSALRWPRPVRPPDPSPAKGTTEASFDLP